MPFFLISKKPLVFVIAWAPAFSFNELFELFSSRRRNERIYCFVQLWWTYIDGGFSLVSFLKNESKKNNIEFYILCNEIEEVEFFSEYFENVVLCSHNAFVDEHIFYPKENSKVFTSIYNACISPYKRYELLTKCKGVGIISYLQHINDYKYFTHIKMALHDLVWVNEKNGEFNWLNSALICDLLNQSSIGLCLSEKEGAMFASIEYLLCGLKIVSTKSVGGREAFFDSSFTIIVEADPYAIDFGIKTLHKKDISPNYIRNNVIEKIKAHRVRYNSIVEKIFYKHGMPLFYSSNGIAGPFRNRLCIKTYLSEIAKVIEV